MGKNLVYGDEPFLVDEFRKKIIAGVKTPEFNLLETGEFSDTEKRFISQYPLFGEKKVLLFRARTLKECQELVAFVSAKPGSTEVYVFPEEIDRRCKTYRAFQKGEIHILNKISPETLERTILQCIKNAGCEIKRDAYQLFLQMVNYYGDDVNLYDVRHAVKRLCQTKTITSGTVENVVADREKEDIYSLIQLIMRRKYADMFRQADLILRNRQNNVIGILSLLLRSYRLAYKTQVCHCSLADIGVTYRTFVPRIPAAACSQAMDLLDGTVRSVKEGLHAPDIALKVTLAKLCNLETEET